MKKKGLQEAMTAARANAGRTVSAGNRSVPEAIAARASVGKVIRRTKNGRIRPRMATSGATRRDVGVVSLLPFGDRLAE